MLKFLSIMRQKKAKNGKFHIPNLYKDKATPSNKNTVLDPYIWFYKEEDSNKSGQGYIMKIHVKYDQICSKKKINIDTK